MAGDLIPYISGGTADIPNFEELKRRRAIATALASRSRPYPKTFGEGLTALGEGVGDALYDYKLNQMEKAQLAFDRAGAKTVPSDSYRTGSGGAVAAPPPVAAPPVAARPVGAVSTPPPPVEPPVNVVPTRPATPPNDPRMLVDPRSVSAADPRASIAQAIMQRDGNAPEEVAQENPTEGGLMTPATNSPGISAGLPGSDPIRLASLGPDAGGVMTDAPPIGGRPMPVPEENPPTPTDIQPIPRAQVAQAGPGLIPGAVAGVPGTPTPGPGARPGGPGAAPDMPPSRAAIPPASEEVFVHPGPEPKRPERLGPSGAAQAYWRIMNDPRYSEDMRSRAKAGFEAEERFRLEIQNQQQETYRNDRERWEKKYDVWEKGDRETETRRLKNLKDRIDIEQAQYTARVAPLEFALKQAELDRQPDVAEKLRREIAKAAVDYHQAIRTLNKPETFDTAGARYQSPYDPKTGTYGPLTLAPGSPQPKMEPLNEAQSKGVQFVMRVTPDLNLLDRDLRYGKVLTMPTEAIRDLPMVGNLVVSNEYRRALNASQNWGAAFLTHVSGAAVSPSEAGRNLPAFLPRAGDTDQDLLDKAARRRSFTDAIRSTVGPEGLAKIEKEVGKANDEYLYTKAGEKPAVRVNSLEEARMLEPGTPLILPDGSKGRVPRRP